MNKKDYKRQFEIAQSSNRDYDITLGFITTFMFGSLFCLVGYIIMSSTNNAAFNITMFSTLLYFFVGFASLLYATHVYNALTTKVGDVVVSGGGTWGYRAYVVTQKYILTAKVRLILSSVPFDAVDKSIRELEVSYRGIKSDYVKVANPKRFLKALLRYGINLKASKLVDNLVNHMDRKPELTKDGVYSLKAYREYKNRRYYVNFTTAHAYLDLLKGKTIPMKIPRQETVKSKKIKSAKKKNINNKFTRSSINEPVIESLHLGEGVDQLQNQPEFVLEKDREHNRPN